MQGRVKLLASFIGLLVPVMLSAKMASGDETFTATKAISLPGGQKITSFDISFVDPRIGNYFLADRTNKSIDIIDTSTNTVAAQYQDNFAGASPAIMTRQDPMASSSPTTIGSGWVTAAAR